MASGLSSPTDTNVIKTVLGFTGTPFTTPTAMGISLHSAALGTAKVLASEWVNGGALNTNYTSRLSVGVGTSNWSIAAFVAGTGVVASNSQQVSFAALTGTGSTLVAVGFNDSLTIGGGNLLFFADVTSQAVATGIVVAFFIGDCLFTLL
jgi:hypothetical protein